MLRFLTAVFGISLVVTLASIAVSRLSASTAFFTLTRQSTNQPRRYNYILSLPDGRGSRIIANAADTNWFIDWLPDSNTILYHDQDVYTYDVRGGDTRRIIESNGSAISFGTLPSPTGDWWLLEIRNTINTQLFRLGKDGTTLQHIADVLSVTSNMAWSSDGDSVFFVNFVNDQFRPLASDGRSITEVTWGERFDQLSPDGQHKVFYTMDAPNVLKIEELATGIITPLTSPPTQYRVLDWRPSDWILIEEIPDRTSPDYDNTVRYFRIRPDGSGLTLLFRAQTTFANQVEPFWIKDWLFVNSVEDDNESLYRINVETTQRERFIENFVPFTIEEIVDPYDGVARAVRLINDWIIWRTPGDNSHLMQTRLDGMITREIYDIPDDVRTPKLIPSPDNQWLYITYFDRRGTWPVDRVHLEEHSVEHVFSGDQSLQTLSPLVDLPLRPLLFVVAVFFDLMVSIMFYQIR
jgi:hypothetical protein